MKVKDKKFKVFPTEEGYYLINNFEAVMSKSEVKEHIDSLQRNIDTLEPDIRRIENGEKYKELDKELEQKRQQVKYKLNNFEHEYQEDIDKKKEELENLQKPDTKEEEYNTLKYWYDNFDEWKQEQIDKLRSQDNQYINQWREQLEHDKELMNIYKDAIGQKKVPTQNNTQ